eukprot:3060477-Amphidinium_carterae.1
MDKQSSRTEERETTNDNQYHSKPNENKKFQEHHVCRVHGGQPPAGGIIADQGMSTTVKISRQAVDDRCQ